MADARTDMARLRAALAAHPTAVLEPEGVILLMDRLETAGADGVQFGQALRNSGGTRLGPGVWLVSRALLEEPAPDVEVEADPGGARAREAFMQSISR